MAGLATDLHSAMASSRGLDLRIVSVRLDRLRTAASALSTGLTQPR
jgi:hypothetical protein